MKVYLLLVVLTILSCCACTHHPKMQRKGYVINIDQDKIGQPRDTVINNKSYEFVWLPTELSNFTKDSFKYMTMTCSWSIIFVLNKKKAFIRGWNCDSNFPSFSSITPQKSFTYNIPVLIEKDAIAYKNCHTFLQINKLSPLLFSKYQHLPPAPSNSVRQSLVV